MGPGQDSYNMNDKETLWAIPKLSPNSSNWVMFKTWFLFTMAVATSKDTSMEATLLPRSPLTVRQTSPDGPLWIRTKAKLTYLSQRNGSMMSTSHVLNSHRLSLTHF